MLRVSIGLNWKSLLQKMKIFQIKKGVATVNMTMPSLVCKWNSHLKQLHVLVFYFTGGTKTSVSKSFLLIAEEPVSAQTASDQPFLALRILTVELSYYLM